MNIEEKLTELGITLPTVSPPAGDYVPTVKSGNLLFVSGQLPSRSGKVLIAGKVGREIELVHAQDAARLCAINALAAIKSQIGSLDQIRQIVRLEVYVNSAPGFTDQSQVANGASQLLNDLFGQAGQHARVAIGVTELPLDAAVELAMCVETK